MLAGDNGPSELGQLRDELIQKGGKLKHLVRFEYKHNFKAEIAVFCLLIVGFAGRERRERPGPQPNCKCIAILPKFGEAGMGMHICIFECLCMLVCVGV